MVALKVTKWYECESTLNLICSHDINLINSRKPCCKTCAIGFGQPGSQVPSTSAMSKSTRAWTAVFEHWWYFPSWFEYQWGKKKERKENQWGNFNLSDFWNGYRDSGNPQVTRCHFTHPIPRTEKRWKQTLSLTSQGTNACCFLTWSALTSSTLPFPLKARGSENLSRKRQ